MRKGYLLGFGFFILSIWIFKTYVPDSFWENDPFITIGIATLYAALFFGSIHFLLKDFFPNSLITKISSYVWEMIYWNWQPSKNPLDKYAIKIAKIIFITIVIILLIVVVFLPKETVTLDIKQIETGNDVIPYKYMITYKEVNFYTKKSMPWHKTWKEEVMEGEK